MDVQLVRQLAKQIIPSAWMATRFHETFKGSTATGDSAMLLIVGLAAFASRGLVSEASPGREEWA
ncbi:hypothetical protein [Microbispora sp. H13382]|uniref:hypothetical protein n=1 Tax=Microbispora sp. H13382 TaxID=2729112 RepID=UPI0016005383|nr:hypothetical protein [Microbispora sp. H13382]